MRETYDLKNDAFISQLEARVRRKIETNVGNFNPPFNYEDEVSPATREVLNASFSIIENFFYQLYEDRMPSEKIEEKIQRYTENTSFYSDNVLKKLYEIRKDKFSQDDIKYIKFTKLTHTWDGRFDYSYGDKYAILDVLFKGSLASEVELVYQNDIKALKQINQLDKVDFNKRKAEIDQEKKYYLDYLDKIFPLKVSDSQYNRALESKIDSEVNNVLNDGSFALEIDTLILPFGYSDLNKSVSCILNNFPFVRLLGNTKLKSSEYLVFYRTDKTGNKHHFVKVDSNHEVVEKNGESPVQYFEGWDEKLDSQIVVFAVKKKHKNFGYHFMNIKIYPDNDLNFKESLAQALKYKQDFFMYRGRSFNISKENDYIKIIYNDNHIANAYYEDENLIVESKPENEKMINSLCCSEPPIMKNGILTNVENFIDIEPKEELNSNNYNESAVANA